jgi:D-arabinose 1-dehydrogenase
MCHDRDLRSMGPFVLGGAGFSYQLTPDPEAAPVASILKAAFDNGVRAIDTSPYYEPSEQLLGAAIQEPTISDNYQRGDYCIMTKVGRITATKFDYSAAWVRHSVMRSLERFNTTYLDVVFAHDVEFVPVEDALVAVRTLFELSNEGYIRHIGISGYDLDVLSTLAELAPSLIGRTIDAIQSWAQMTLQNNRLESHGLAGFRNAGVKMVFASSPLATGLLRAESVPLGRLGDWHPAPQGLRVRAHEAAGYVASQGEDLAALALRYALRKAGSNTSQEMSIQTICGVSTITELLKDIAAVKAVVEGEKLLTHNGTSDECAVETRARTGGSDSVLCERVQEILGSWIDFDFSKQERVQRDCHAPQDSNLESIARPRI